MCWVLSNLPCPLLRNRLRTLGLFHSSTLVLLLHIMLIITVPNSHANSDVEEIELNVERISELGNTDVLLSTISRLALALNKCGVDVRGLKELQRVMLPSDTNAKCMDGSTAGYVFSIIRVSHSCQLEKFIFHCFRSSTDLCMYEQLTNWFWRLQSFIHQSTKPSPIAVPENQWPIKSYHHKFVKLYAGISFGFGFVYFIDH